VTGKHIYRPTSGGGSASIAGITTSTDGSSGSNFGNLTETAGAAASIRVESLPNGTGSVLPAQNITAGNSVTAYAIMRDSFSNFITNGPAETWFLPVKSGGVADGDLVPSGNGKSAVFTGHLTGTATIRATSGTLAQSDSGTQTIVAGSATKLFVTLPNESFVVGSGNSGTVITQRVGVPFAITRLTAVDNFTNIATTYSGSKIVTYSGPAGNPTYTTNVSFTTGFSTNTLTTTLSEAETTRITATASGLTGVASSALIVKPANTPPEIAPIASQTVYVDHPALFKLYTRDLETATNNLQLSFLSSNAALFPVENAVFHYFLFDADGPHWYLTLVPTFGRTGTGTNTLLVSDGTNTTTANFVVTVNPPPPGAARFANTNSVTIGDVGPAIPYPWTNSVTGMGGVITNLTLTLSKINHQWIKDVHMLLVSPTGQRMVVFSRISRAFVTNITATLADAAPFVLPDDFDLWSEQFKPTDLATTNGTFSDNNFPPPAPAGPYGPVSFSNSFNGLPANGTWSLYIYDDHTPSQGGITGGWSLMIATTGDSTPPLKILSVIGAGTTNVVITWSAISNVTYRVQYKADLNAADWSNLAPDVTATNTTASATDHPVLGAHRFYRVTVP
jgi:subtilisin-like proprotein convertase family protein